MRRISAFSFGDHPPGDDPQPDGEGESRHDRTEDDLDRARSGDELALQRLLERYRERVLRIARVRVGPRLATWTDPEDLVQETLLQAMNGIRSFDPRQAPRLILWFAGILENRIRDAAKGRDRDMRNPGREVPYESAMLPGAAPASPSQLALRAEQAARFDECVHALPAHYRDVILYRQYADLAWDDIAKLMGRPTGKAAFQLHERALDALEPALRASGFELPG